MTRSKDDIALDLPFYVNGTLDAPARAEFEALMAEDALLRAEVEDLRAIRADMQAEDMHSPGEFGLARLMRDAGTEQATRLAAAQPPVGKPRSRVWMWQAAAAVAMAALIGQNLLGGFGATGTDMVRSREAASGYGLASADEGPALVVSFAPDATEAQIRALLLDLGLEINSGPSALGLYRLAQAEAEHLDAEARALMAASGIVESVENAQN